MGQNDIYCDIAKRTNGDIYIGVVGPVRTGKSTFIKKFMETLVIPNIESSYMRDRAIDELPQSAAGKTIMTTEPKFIPEEAVEVTLSDKASMKVRLIDCVGYIVPSSLGYIENEMPRMVMTPWFDEEVPFNMAAEVGTQKVINEHSTIGLVVTSDGTITDIPREEYEECEQRVISELKSINKPFVVLMNSVNPEDKNLQEMCMQLQAKYNTPVIPVNCLQMNEEDIKYIMTQILYSFPIKEINIQMPRWITSLKKGHWLKDDIYSAIRDAALSVNHIREVKGAAKEICKCNEINDAKINQIQLGTGSVTICIDINSDLFYKILGEETGVTIDGENDLFPMLRDLINIKKKFQKIQNALDEVEATGYGIVLPTIDELELEEPEIVKQGGRYGVRLKASASSIHMMKANINTEVNPIVGSEKQSEELLMYMMKEFEENPKKIWDSNIFGKSLHELVNEGLHNKLNHMPIEARIKLQETLEKIINEGCSGLICLIL